MTIEASLKAGRLADDDMGLNEFIAIVWRRKWWLVLITLFAVASAFAISQIIQPVFEASTTLLIDQASGLNPAEYSAIIASDKGTRTYAELLKTRPVLEETYRRLELDANQAETVGSIRVELVEDTQLIELSIEHPDPMLAAAIANTMVEVFTEQNDAFQASRFAASKISLSAQLDKINDQTQTIEAAILGLGVAESDTESSELLRLQVELAQKQASYVSVLQTYEELRLAEAQSISNIIQVEPAEPPGDPIRPQTMFNVLIAGAVGAGIALGIVFLIEHLDDSIRTPKEVARVTGLQVFGYVERSKKLSARGIREKLMVSESSSSVAESFRSLRTNIELAGNQGIPKSILVSSAGQGDGKTTIAAQLAVSMALGGKKVVLLDANLRQPALHQYFGIENGLGLSDMIVDDLVPQVVSQEVIHWRLKVISSGKPIENPAELMGSVHMLKLLARLREQADVAIFDGPPMLVAESYVLASKLESVLIVMHFGRTRQAVVKQMMEQLGRAQANAMGIVMNRVPIRMAHGLSGNLAYGNGRDSRSPTIEGETQIPVMGQAALRRQP